MPRFDPFPALRYCDPDVDDLIAPPYDVLSNSDLDELNGRNRYNITHIDVPRESDGPDRYVAAARRLHEWVDAGVMAYDDTATFTINRLRFCDSTGRNRDIVGVLGGLEVVDPGAGGVLPHERVTPKASTDRLDLTRATDANLSPVWGLSLASGLTSLLTEPGTPLSSVTVGGVEHVVERVDDPTRIAAIRECVGSDDVLIADGHHRYGVAQRHRDEVRAATGRTDTPAEGTLAFVSELVADQLSVEAIHRLYSGIDTEHLIATLDRWFERSPAVGRGPSTDDLAAMVDPHRLQLISAAGREWLLPRQHAFADVRSIDGAWLEAALDGLDYDVTYEHDLDRVDAAVKSGAASAAILINPVSVAEIERTAREGALMPPKSTYFTPKLRTGFVIRSLT
ncbi:MAG: DUF1015 domain-containing protein [Ilumatobacteraceae bacterium]|nr:DUF1015 domain-containing protein [Ilumatobacteraceae bacterium]